MQIIIVAKPHATPATLDLRCWRGRFKVGIFAVTSILLCACMGFGAAILFANPRDSAISDVRSLHDEVVTQKQALSTLEVASRRDLDALALQLGSLQAQATRLNALGQRLTQIGKLDDGEFDFNEPPAMGGPEDPAASAHALDNSLSSNITELRTRFEREETELNVLENLLLDRRVDRALLPSGYPVATGYIGSGFGNRADPMNGFNEYHSGLDFDAPMGSDITAVAEGVVVFNGEKAGYGNVVEIDHGNGYMTRYAHNSKNVAQVGERVHAGQVIAKVGMTGRATGPHCHFEVLLHGRAVNPLTYVNGTAKRA